MLEQKRPKRLHPKFLTWDIETYKWKNFYLGAVYDGKKLKYFDNIKDMVEYQLQPKFGGYHQYAHFGGRFDFNFFLEEFLGNPKFSYYDLKIIPLNSGLLCFKIKRSLLNKVWWFYDSFRILPLSLKKLTDSFNVANKKKELNYSRIRSYKIESVKDYLKNDVVGLYQVMDKFRNWDLIKKVGIKPTIAAQSLACFQYFLSNRICDMPPCDEKYMRLAYYGGRVEIFNMKAKNIYCYDINSLYPSVMRDNVYPISKPLMSGRRYVEGKLGVYNVEVIVPNIYNIPPVPYKEVKSKKYMFSPLIFPVGKFITYLTSHDIEYIRIAYPKIRIKFNHGMYWNDSVPLFYEFVEYFNYIKSRADKKSAQYIISKLLMNSLYGKFATRREKTIISSASADNVIRTISCGDYSLDVLEMNYRAGYIIPSLSLMVTSLARIELSKLLNKCEDVVYCDTDSVFTKTKLPVNNELGGLKLEYKIKRAIFLLPKCYILELKDGTYVKKVKGFPKDMLEKVTFETFEKALYDDDYTGFTGSKIVFGSFKENLRRHNPIVSMIKKTLSINKRYDKRIVNDDYTTKPIMISRRKG